MEAILAELKTFQKNAKARKAAKDSLAILKGIDKKAKTKTYKTVNGPPDLLPLR